MAALNTTLVDDLARGVLIVGEYREALASLNRTSIAQTAREKDCVGRV